MTRKRLAGGCALLLVAALLSGLWLRNAIHEPLDLPSSGAIVSLQPGQSLSQLLVSLVQQGYLKSAQPLAGWARLQGLDRLVKAGEYQLARGTTGASLLRLLAAGEVVTYRVTLPEGITLAEAIQRLHDDRRIEQTLSGPEDPQLLKLVRPAASAEGLFLPETYQFVRGDSDLDILVHARRLFEEALRTAWQSRSADSPLKSAYEAAILASIVERETSVPEERAAIAGVFSRRLQRGMRLQTDPTIIYGLGEAYTGNLTRQHLADAGNPWNTYRIAGLPPTPIALPGRAALFAAVQPEAGDALYFVARGDGYHAFSATLEEHNAKVKQFQLARRSDYRSTPAPGD